LDQRGHVSLTFLFLTAFLLLLHPFLLQHQTAPTSSVYLGVMSSNFSGTQFTMHDYRINKSNKSNKKNNSNDPIHELGVVLYETNVTGRVPNSLRALGK
jgi:hypothetical protein